MGFSFKSIMKNLFLYITIFILVFAGLYLLEIIKDKYILSAVFSFLALIFVVLILKIWKRDIRPSVGDEGMIRYSMLCKNCNWEWMSNTTDKKSPSKCPNCGEKKRLEIVGWRRVQYYQEQKNHELGKFLRG